MDDPLTRSSADAVRGRIAALLDPGTGRSEPLGSISLQPHQRAAVARIAAAMREFGGALLADETGLGKTFVALSIARDADRPLVVAPAALREMWRQAADSAGVAVGFVSAESLSRSRAAPVRDPDLVIVDESHHFRNPATARYRALTALTARARVLLLSATPVHNSADDLTTLLSLFLGGRASTLDPSWISRCVVRRSPHDVPSARVPQVGPPEPLRIEHDERHLDAILALPPPVPPIDGGDGGTLLIYSLLRQWASTRAALGEALRRRLARATALLAALETGRHPSASELAAWAFTEGTVQLAFPELVVDRAHAAPTAHDLAACVQSHAEAIRALLGSLSAGPDTDAQRAAHLAALSKKHARAKIVVFSQYAESVSAMFASLRDRPGVAALTAAGGRVAGGTLTRREVLARFAPRAQGVAPPRAADGIDLLLTTDLLSEGVNLQDASVVVHLDVPWTPARLDQRAGRLARLGSAHERIAVYAMLPPAGVERIVRVEHRLREKLGVATRTVGLAGTIIPSLTLGGSPPSEPAANERAAPALSSPAELGEATHGVLGRWRRGGAAGPGSASDGSAAAMDVPPSHCVPIVAAVEAPVAGFVAVVGDAVSRRILADTGRGPTADPATVLEALRAAEGSDIPLDEEVLAAALGGVARWRSTSRLHRELSVDGALRARARRTVADRIAAITRRAPRHRRPAIAALATAARGTVTARFGAGAERVLGELAGASMPDEAWLRAVSTFGAIHGTVDELEPGTHRLLALLALVPARRIRTPAEPGRKPPSRVRSTESMGGATDSPEPTGTLTTASP